MLLTRTVAPADFITQAEVKAHLRIDHSYDDATITAVRLAAMAMLDGRDGYLRRAICTQSWRWSLPEFPLGDELHFLFPPLRSVTSVQYYDGDGVLQTYDASKYRVHSDAYVGYLKLVNGSAWPATIERDDAVQLTFECGYGAPADVPAPIKHAALIRCGALYATRGDNDGDPASQTQASEAAFTIAEQRLLGPYRLTEFGISNAQYWSQARTRPHR